MHALLFGFLPAPVQPRGRPDIKKENHIKKKQKTTFHNSKHGSINKQNWSTQTLSRVSRSSWFSKAERDSLDDSNCN